MMPALHSPLNPLYLVLVLVVILIIRGLAKPRKANRVYDCSKCRDTGRYTPHFANGQPRPTRQVCDCAAGMDIRKLLYKL